MRFEKQLQFRDIFFFRDHLTKKIYYSNIAYRIIPITTIQVKTIQQKFALNENVELVLYD